MQKPQPKVFVDHEGHSTVNGAPVKVQQRTELVPMNDHSYEMAQMRHEMQQMMCENETAMRAMQYAFAPPQSLLRTAENLFDDVTNSVTFVEEIDLYWE